MTLRISEWKEVCMMAEKRCYTVAELQEILGVSRPTVYSLLKRNEFSFISHDSVLKLNDIRTVSVNRILYQHKGRIVPSSDTYKQIEALTLQKYFPSFYYDYQQTLQTVETLTEKVKEITTDKKVIETENEQLKAKIEFFKKQ